MRVVGAWVAVLLAAAPALAADIYARKMEIARTPEGQATIFRDSVVITDDGTRIDARLARMYQSRGLAVISESVRIQNPDARIKADSARYYLSDKRAELYGNVRVRRESLDIESPMLVWRSRQQLVQADSGLVLSNPERSFRLAGRRGDLGALSRLPELRLQRALPPHHA